MPPDDSNSSAPRAVMLFFYGGSFKYGTAMLPLYDGSHFSSHGVVTVACNYRLNAFGYLGAEALRATDGSTGNFGLQDQRLAMQWVRRNAKFLNADVTRVMVFGESAGSGSVANHLVAERSWGLFSRAGMESGPIAYWVTTTVELATKAFDTMAANLKCNATSGSVVACMRSASAVDVLEASDKVGALPPTLLLKWSPVIDGVEIKEAPWVLAARGQLAPNVSVLLGTNQDEGTLFNDQELDINRTTIEGRMSKHPLFHNSSEDAAKVLHAPPSLSPAPFLLRPFLPSL